MQPIAILQHERCRGPEVLVSMLRRRGLPFRLFQVAEGDGVARSARDFAGIVLLDSYRSLREGLPWMDAEMSLVRQSIDTGVPLFALGLGAHLIARALSHSAPRASATPPGWSRAQVTPWGRSWLGGVQTLEVFGWHCENLALPARAQRLLFNEHCQTLGFVAGRHVALQCALDVDSEALHDWATRGRRVTRSLVLQPLPSAQQILLNSGDRLARLRQALDSLYSRWLDSLTLPALARERQARAA
jgi:GMP synthase (glutamine-hydrolysing)